MTTGLPHAAAHETQEITGHPAGFPSRNIEPVTQAVGSDRVPHDGHFLGGESPNCQRATLAVQGGISLLEDRCLAVASTRDGTVSTTGLAAGNNRGATCTVRRSRCWSHSLAFVVEQSDGAKGCSRGCQRQLEGRCCVDCAPVLSHPKTDVESYKEMGGRRANRSCRTGCSGESNSGSFGRLGMPTETLKAGTNTYVSLPTGLSPVDVTIFLESGQPVQAYVLSATDDEAFIRGQHFSWLWRGTVGRAEQTIRVTIPRRSRHYLLIVNWGKQDSAVHWEIYR